MSLKIGCSGFQEARTKYFNEFNLVEIQQSFFQPPPIATVRKWHHQAPRDFEFTIKAWQLITHESNSSSYQNLREKLPARALNGCGLFKPTRIVFDAWLRTKAIAEALHAKVVVFQTARNFLPTPINIQNMRKFFQQIDRQNINCVWEPMNRWPFPLVQQLCDDLQLSYTGEPTSSNAVALGPIRYFRLMGKNGFRSRYNENDFKFLQKLDNNGKNCYFIFNNASMLFDARNFSKYFLENKFLTQKSSEPDSGDTAAFPDSTEN